MKANATLNKAIPNTPSSKGEGCGEDIKRLLLVFIFLLTASSIFAQASLYNYSYGIRGSATSNPSSLNAEADNAISGWTAVSITGITAASSGATTSSLNKWSSSVTLPFSFSFYGEAVSSCNVSLNGLVSFASSLSGVAVTTSNNASLPSTELPDKTIACYWDQYTIKDASDWVYTKTFGTAPNRQFWIKWHSMKTGNPASANNGYALVLEETSNTIYFVDLYKTTTAITASLGIQYDATTGITINSNAALASASTATTNNYYYSLSPVLISSIVTSSNYISETATSGSNPAGLNTSADNAITPSTTWSPVTITGITSASSGSTTSTLNKWSSSISLPFSFSFYGEAVSSCNVSLNGLLSFASSLSGVAVSTSDNTALPSTQLPDKTIACYWDKYTIKDASDWVYTATFGTSPNRQFWIKWNSMKTGYPASANNFYAIVLEESTNRIYLVDLYKSTTAISATLGVQYNSTTYTNLSSSASLLSTTSAYTNNNYYSLSPTYNDLEYSYNDLSVPSTKYMVRDLTVPCASPYELKSAVLKVQLDAGEEYTLGSEDGFSASVDFHLTAYSNIVGRGQILEISDELSISNTAPTQLYVVDITHPAYSYNNYSEIDYLSFSVTASTLDAILQNKLRLRVWIETEYNIGVEEAAYCGDHILSAFEITSVTNPVEFTWYTCDAYCNSPYRIPLTELQLLRLYNEVDDPLVEETERDLTTTVDWSKALSVLVDGSETSLKLQLNEGTGYYAWRIRPIGNFYEGAEANSQNWGNWNAAALVDGAAVNYTSTTSLPWTVFFFTQPEEDKNWIYNRVFTEDTRISENMAYADGLGKIHQKQHKMQSDNTTLITQSIYDYSGRQAIQSMAAPVSNNELLYKSNYLTHEGELYNAVNFDTESNSSNPDPVNGGALSDYYSDDLNKQPDLSVPNSENYPFSQSIIDPLGRAKEAAGADETFRIGGGSDEDGDGVKTSRTYKTYYSSVTEDELVMLFAKEAPDASKVRKIISIDPNKLTTITYQLADGTVLATCLSGESGLMESVNTEPYTVSGTVNGDMQLDEYTIEKSEVLPPFLEPSFEIHVNYNLTPSQIEADCGNFCTSCDYEVEVWVKNTETGLVVDGGYWTLAFGPNACLAEDRVVGIGGVKTVSGLEPGTYAVGRTIKVKNTSSSTTNEHLEDHLIAINADLQTNIDDNYANLRELLANNNLDGFYAALQEEPYNIPEAGLVDGNTITLNEGCCPISFTVEKCTLPCDEETPDFEALLTDKWGDQYGKHMYSYFWSDASNYEHLYEVSTDPIATIRFTNLGDGVVGANISIKVIPDNQSLNLPNIELIDKTYSFNGLHALAGQIATDINNLGLDSYSATANDGILTVTSHLNNYGYVGHIEITYSEDYFDIANTDPVTNETDHTETAIVDFTSTDLAIDGYFNLMISHMLDEVNPDGISVYNCTDLYNAWNALVQTYEISQYDIVASGTLAGYHTLKDYNLMEAFLKSVGKIYAGISNHPYDESNETGEVDYGYGYLEYAYKSFELDISKIIEDPIEHTYTYTDGSTIIDYTGCISSSGFDITNTTIWEADLIDEDSETKLWENFYNCIASADEYATDGFSDLTDATGIEVDCDAMDAACVYSMVEDIEDACLSTCLSHLDGFKYDAEQLLISKGTSYTSDDVDCIAHSMVEECEKNCQLTIDFVDANNNGTYDDGETLNRVGTDEEIENMQKAMTYMLKLEYGEDCNNISNDINYNIDLNSSNNLELNQGSASSDVEVYTVVTDYSYGFANYIVDKCNQNLQQLVDAGIHFITPNNIDLYFLLQYNIFMLGEGQDPTLTLPCEFNWGVNSAATDLSLDNFMEERLPINENSEVVMDNNGLLSFYYAGGVIEDMVNLSQCGGQIETCTFCYRWEPLEIPTEVVNTIEVITCDEASTEAIEAAFDAQLEDCKNEQLAYFEDTYDATCASPENINDKLVYSYEQNYHHFTLFYYDRAGRLIKTVPPKGVSSNGNFPYSERTEETNYGFATTYEFNSLGQMVTKTSVDAGTVNYYYNSLGQLRYSQNGEQARTNKYSYIKYDYLGRPIEAGQGSIGSTEDIQASSELHTKVDDETIPSTGEEIIVTVFNDASSEAVYTDINGVTYTQEYLDNRISYTYSDEDGLSSTTEDRIYTYYSYSPHGNVEWFIQDIPGLGKIQTWFEYDLVSQKVTEVKYQEGKADQYYYRYSYDEDGRLVKSETSRNAQLWDADATYEYYAFGPAKRTVIGQDKVQGLDYIYTLQGWLKAINHPELGNGSDAGQDGVVGSVNETIPADAFGEVLNYYEGDFKRTGSAFNNTSSGLLSNLNTTHGVSGNANLKSYYNGFISNTITNNAASGVTNKAQQAMASMYLYDDMGRLVQSTIDFYGGSAWENSTGINSDYFEHFEYDDNGNITGATRNTY